MSVVIVAILNGRTKEEWYTWVTDRVKQNYGYKTPESVPELYSQARLAAFRERKKREEERRRRAAQVEKEKKAEQEIQKDLPCNPPLNR
jgi:protein phosphatase 2C family protein 2/3